MAHLRFLVFCFFLISGLVAAEEVRVLGDDRRILAGGGGWNYNSNICPGAGFLATTNRGAYATLLFQGTAISTSLLTVYNGALATVYLDGNPLASNVDLLDPGGQAYQCSTKVINATDLVNTVHNITIVHAGKSPHALAGEADWVVIIETTYTGINVAISSTMYTSRSTSTASESSSSSSPGSSAALIGGIVGGVGGLLLGVGIAFYCFRRRQSTAEPVTTFQPDNDAHFTIEQSPEMATGIDPRNPYLASAVTPASSSDPASLVAPTPYHIYPSAPAITLGDVDLESRPPPPQYTL